LRLSALLRRLDHSRAHRAGHRQARCPGQTNARGRRRCG
jgi:hypothetical protein